YRSGSFLAWKLIKSKNGNSWWWGCSEFKQGCKAMYYDDNGKPKIINV
ncbi:hypothetical protein KVG56_001808, partial [Campylobacter jejuni]|nr:hypothetical protein [Campylobacter jejuni]